MNEVSINQQNQKTTKMFKTNFFFFFFFFFTFTDGPGPIGPPPKAPSPMPPCTPPLNDTKGLMDDRRVPRPIGGERSHRKAPGPPPVAAANMAAVGEYGKLWALNAELTGEWTPTTSPLMSSAPIPASVITSSVITGGNMAYDVNAVAAQDGDGPPSDAPDGNSFSDSLPVDPATEQNFQVTRFYGVCLGLRGASTCAPVSHLSVSTESGIMCQRERDVAPFP